MDDDERPEHIERMLRHPVNAGRPWTADHDAYIRRYIGVIGCRAVAYRLGRSRRAVYERASRLGVAAADCGRGRTWTAEEEAMLTEWLQRAAAALGRTEQSVAARAQRMANTRK